MKNYLEGLLCCFQIVFWANGHSAFECCCLSAACVSANRLGRDFRYMTLYETDLNILHLSKRFSAN